MMLIALGTDSNSTDTLCRRAKGFNCTRQVRGEKEYEVYWI